MADGRCPTFKNNFFLGCAKFVVGRRRRFAPGGEASLLAQGAMICVVQRWRAGHIQTDTEGADAE